MKTYTNFDFSIRMALVALALVIASLLYAPLAMAAFTVSIIAFAHSVLAFFENRRLEKEGE